jgi:hypothetical protein
VPRLRTLALAVSGVVIGHALAYMAAAPDAVSRAALLRTTGHAYWRSAVLAAALGGLWYAGDHATRLFRAGRRGSPTLLSPHDLTLHLRVLQVTLFIALEVGERAHAGVPVVSVLTQRVFLFGVLFQVLLAPLLAAAVRLVGAAARAVGRATRGERFLATPPVAVFATAYAGPFPAGVPSTPCGIRGPPLS